MDTEEELISQLEGFNPLTDTGRALKFLIRYVAEHNHQSDVVDQETLSRLQDLTKVVLEIRKLEQGKHGGLIRIWAWVKNSLSHAAEEAKKIRIE